ncbi:MAG: hypothetical protein KDD36_08305 [Flavobacteriales bacterium]|nr:hypothetical protein [Flavobacteriales bacterium]
MKARSHIFILLIASCLFTTGLQAQDAVTVSQKFVPDHVKSGTPVTVEITVNKGNIGGIGKIQQILPKGFVAKPIDLQQGTFTQEDRVMKIIWLALPQTPKFVVKYELSTNDAEGGSTSLGGKFSYMLNAEKKNIDIPTQRVLIETDETKVNVLNISGEGDSKEARTLVLDNKPSSGKTPASDSTPVVENTQEENTDDLTSASAEQAKEEAKRIEEEKAAEKKKEEEKQARLKEAEEKKAREEKARKAEEEANAKAKQEAENKAKAAEEARLKAEKEAADKKAKEEEEAKKVAEVQAMKVEEPKATEAAPPQKTEAVPEKPTPPASDKAHEVVFRVQIGAAQSKVPVSVFENKYNLKDEKIYVDYVNGWYKYSVGDYSKATQASFKRKILVDKNGVKGAFIIAFDKGKYIPVTDAKKLAGG